MRNLKINFLMKIKCQIYMILNRDTADMDPQNSGLDYAELKTESVLSKIKQLKISHDPRNPIKKYENNSIYEACAILHS
jgi:hypothetical protein